MCADWYSTRIMCSRVGGNRSTNQFVFNTETHALKLFWSSCMSAGCFHNTFSFDNVALIRSGIVCRTQCLIKFANVVTRYMLGSALHANGAFISVLIMCVCVCVFVSLRRKAVPPVVPTPLETYVAKSATVFTHSAYT